MRCFRLKRFLRKPSIFQVIARNDVDAVETGGGLLEEASTARVELSEAISLTMEKSFGCLVQLGEILLMMQLNS